MTSGTRGSATRRTPLIRPVGASLVVLALLYRVRGMFLSSMDMRTFQPPRWWSMSSDVQRLHLPSSLFTRLMYLCLELAGSVRERVQGFPLTPSSCRYARAMMQERHSDAIERNICSFPRLVCDCHLRPRTSATSKDSRSITNLSILRQRPCMAPPSRMCLTWCAYVGAWMFIQYRSNSLVIAATMMGDFEATPFSFSFVHLFCRSLHMYYVNA